MKKFILFTFIFISILTIGCSMNAKNNNSEKVIHQASNNMDKLMNAQFKDVEKSFGTPYSSVYYIDLDKIPSKDIKNLTMEDIRDSITILSSYNNKKDNNYIHVYYEDDKVKDALAGSYNLSNSDRFTSKDRLSQADYKVEFFKYKGIICNDYFNLEHAREDFIGKEINNFNNNYNVKTANFIASTVNSNDKIYFYPLLDHKMYPSEEHKHSKYGSNNNTKLDTVNPVNNNISNTNKTNNKNLSDYSKSAVLVHTKNDKIQSINIVDNNFILGLINKTFSK